MNRRTHLRACSQWQRLATRRNQTEGASRAGLQRAAAAAAGRTELLPACKHKQSLRDFPGLTNAQQLWVACCCLQRRRVRAATALDARDSRCVPRVHCGATERVVDGERNGARSARDRSGGRTRHEGRGATQRRGRARRLQLPHTVDNCGGGHAATGRRRRCRRARLNAGIRWGGPLAGSALQGATVWIRSSEAGVAHQPGRRAARRRWLPHTVKDVRRGAAGHRRRRDALRCGLRPDAVRACNCGTKRRRRETEVARKRC